MPDPASTIIRRRKPHRKSRGGCGNCKIRRIKVGSLSLSSPSASGWMTSADPTDYSVMRANRNARNAYHMASLAIMILTRPISSY